MTPLDEIQNLRIENERLRDFVRNVAGLDDGQLLNTRTLKEWREDARRLLDQSR